ncbi:hypothetical protein GIB67_002318 [Kingdonia uniflora]|uniref:Uncharacterized protein n=1 Tax=Kingdonia uniflora TaxID=39325 RepID=A0A7J7KX47_9MAGN|nr:hypothetical protein GIB67_002318 [Kingdonia uniflora]
MITTTYYKYLVFSWTSSNPISPFYSTGDSFHFLPILIFNVPVYISIYILHHYNQYETQFNFKPKITFLTKLTFILNIFLGKWISSNLTLIL